MQPETEAQERVAITYRLPAPLHERLRAAAYEQRESQNDIVVRAVERELKEEGK